MIEELGIEYKYYDLTLTSIDYDLLVKIYEENDYKLKQYFNTSGVEYRNNNIKDLFESKTDAEMLEIISKNGLLLKRPFIIDKKVYIGNKLEELESDYKK